ncbi:MAG: hypothetical protein ACRETA_10810 [Gammaproteobacteria bacterium]
MDIVVTQMSTKQLNFQSYIKFMTFQSIKKRVIALIVGLALLWGGVSLHKSGSHPLVCQDGWPSGSIGRQGACSHHGGVDRSPIEEREGGTVLVFFGLLFLVGAFLKDGNSKHLRR